MKLNQHKKGLFRRGGVDSFVFATNGSLGSLDLIKLRHDNSGKNNMASWFLKFIIVHDLQTRERLYFICDKWLSVDRDDGRIDRIIPASGMKQKTEFKYLLNKETKGKLSDGHLWLSVFMRPVQSTFTRLDRITCCFVLLYLSMMVNILYYGQDTSADSGGLKLGPFCLTIQELSIGIISNLIVFPPSILILQIFRRSRQRVTRFSKLMKTFEESKKLTNTRIFNNEENTNGKSEKQETKKKKPKKSKRSILKSLIDCKLPWWFKIISYLLCIVVAGTCIFFIVIKGIILGDEKVSKWLGSLLMSFLTSVFIIQPFQVAVITFFLVIICRSANDKRDLENDDDNDNGESLNKDWVDAGFEARNFYGEFSENILGNGQLEELKRKRSMQIRAKNLLREILFNICFLLALFMTTYSFHDAGWYNYKNSISKFFIDPNFAKVNSKIIKLKMFKLVYSNFIIIF